MVKHGGADGIFTLFSMFMVGLGSSMWASFQLLSTTIGLQSTLIGVDSSGYSTIEPGCDESLMVLALSCCHCIYLENKLL